MPTAALFKQNQSQAVRIPKALEFSSEVKRVEVCRVGDTITLRPEGQFWNDWFNSAQALEGVELERDQSQAQKREAF